ncbi:hypothetical protein CR969_02215 [Candidatus Saccharibacteria bacterium]|nr:MAG: hypothetical protein CR969_02215 [Candidatus Saccharibacteria bacterium]
MARRSQQKIVKKSKRSNIILTAIILGLLSSTAFFAWQANYLKDQANNSQSEKVKQVNELRAKIEKLIIIPKEERVLVGTYKADTDLAKDPFFKDAKDGDKYLIFSESGKAIIYRESDNKLVNVGPIAVKNDSKTDNGVTTENNR